jgi:hypothetical protein
MCSDNRTASAAYGVCLKASGAVAFPAADGGQNGELLLAKELWPVQAERAADSCNTSTPVPLASCTDGSSHHTGAAGLRLAALAAAAAAVLAVCAAGLLAFRAVQQRRRQRQRGRGSAEEGIQLLAVNASQSGGGSSLSAQVRHAELDQLLSSLRRGAAARPPSAEQLLVEESSSGGTGGLLPGMQQGAGGSSDGGGRSASSGPPSASLPTSITFGPLSLRLTDLVFCRGAAPAGSVDGPGSQQAGGGLVELGAGASSKVGGAPCQRAPAL